MERGDSRWREGEREGGKSIEGRVSTGRMQVRFIFNRNLGVSLCCLVRLLGVLCRKQLILKSTLKFNNQFVTQKATMQGIAQKVRC